MSHWQPGGLTVSGSSQILIYFCRPFSGHISRLRLGKYKNVQLGFITYTMNDKTEEVYCKVGKIFKVGDKVNFKTIHRPSYDRV